MDPYALHRRQLIAAAAALTATSVPAFANSPEAIADNVLTTTPENQAATLRNTYRLRATRPIRRGAKVLPLPPSAMSLANLSYDHAGTTQTVDSYMARNRTAGLIVLKDGKIALERYGMGNTSTTRWTSFSTAKSMTATLLGCAVHDGSIKSLDDPVERYLPVLKGSAYEGVTVRNIARMSSGIAWTEEYVATGTSDIARMGQALASGQKSALIDLMRTRPRAVPQGTKFNYSTGEACLLGFIVAAATGKSLPDYYSEKIWSRVGMEADGYWELEAPGGVGTGGMGVNARLRDYARFGQFILNEGALADGTRVLPKGWRDLAGHPDAAPTAYGALEPGYPLGYGYQWWAFPEASPTPEHNRAFTAQGIFGQFVYVNPRERVVAVIWSAWRNAWETPAELETYALLAAAVRTLRGKRRRCGRC